MSVIDDYLANVHPAQRAELERIRAIAMSVIPEAQEVICYAMPTIKYKGQAVIGFDAHKNHIGIYPYSGRVIPGIKELNNYRTTKGAIREDLDRPLSKALIERIIKARLQQLADNQ